MSKRPDSARRAFLAAASGAVAFLVAPGAWAEAVRNRFSMTRRTFPIEPDPVDPTPFENAAPELGLDVIHNPMGHYFATPGQAWADMAAGGYQLETPIAEYPAPDWNGDDFSELFQVAYRERIIRDMDHAAVKEQLGL